MLTVILSEIAAVNSDAACWMPARKLAGAAMAAASNRRLMVRPPDVTATTVAGPLCALGDCVASPVRAGADGITTCSEPSWPDAGRYDGGEKGVGKKLAF